MWVRGEASYAASGCGAMADVSKLLVRLGAEVVGVAAGGRRSSRKSSLELRLWALRKEEEEEARRFRGYPQSRATRTKTPKFARGRALSTFILRQFLSTK